MSSTYPKSVAWGAIALAFCLVALAARPAPAQSHEVSHYRGERGLSYVVLGTAEELAPVLAQIGGSVRAEIALIGASIVEAQSPEFLGELEAAGFRGVPDLAAPMGIEPQDAQGGAVFPLPPAPYVPLGEKPLSLVPFQWPLKATRAEQGHRHVGTGAGVKVAIIDTGVDVDHPDLVDNLNLGLAGNFDPTGAPLDPPDGQYLHHGTFMAGVVGAAANHFGLTGFAPDAEIIPIKVDFGDMFVTLASILQAFDHAVAVGADVISMSFLYYLPVGDDGCYPWGGCLPPGLVDLILDLAGTAATAAHEAGVTMFAAAGNQGYSLDLLPVVAIPAMLPHVIGVAWSGPHNWAEDRSRANMFHVARRSNTGTELVDFIGPGGKLSALRDAPEVVECTFRSLTAPCLWFDAVPGITVGGYTWGVGSSMATPALAGIAAQILEANGGVRDPDLVYAELQRRSIDLGEPGFDAVFGHGHPAAWQSGEGQ